MVFHGPLYSVAAWGHHIHSTHYSIIPSSSCNTYAVHGWSASAWQMQPCRLVTVHAWTAGAAVDAVDAYDHPSTLLLHGGRDIFLAPSTNVEARKNIQQQSAQHIVRGWRCGMCTRGPTAMKTSPYTPLLQLSYSQHGSLQGHMVCVVLVCSSCVMGCAIATAWRGAVHMPCIIV